MQIDKKSLRYLFGIVLGALLLYWGIMDTERAKTFFINIWSLIAPFAIGGAIGFVLNVPMRSVERRLEWVPKPGLRRLLAIVITLVLFIIIIAFILLLLIPQLKNTIRSLVDTLPEFVIRETEHIRLFMEKNPEIRQWITEYTSFGSIDWAGLVQRFATFLGESLSKLFGGAFNAIGSVATAIMNAFLSICFAFYTLSRKEILARQGKMLLYSFLPESWADEAVRVLRLTSVTFSNFISGQCLEACILGGMFVVGMAIFGLPYIPLVSVIIAVTALIPIVGAFAGCFLGVIFILVESPVQAFTFLILFLILQQIEGNLIYPKVVGTSIGLPGMWVLVALSVGGELMGIGGMLIMIPLASVLYALLGEFTRKRIKDKEIPDYKLEPVAIETKSAFRMNRERRKQQELLNKMKAFAKQATDKGKKNTK